MGDEGALEDVYMMFRQYGFNEAHKDDLRRLIVQAHAELQAKAKELASVPVEVLDLRSFKRAKENTERARDTHCQGTRLDSPACTGAECRHSGPTARPGLCSQRSAVAIGLLH